MDPLLADFEQLAAGLVQGRALVEIADEFGNVLAFRVSLAVHAVGGYELVCFAPQILADLVSHPDKELDFFALAVGVLNAIESSRLVKYLAHDIVEDFLGDGAEELVAGDLLGVEIDAGQLGVVLKHLIEVGRTVQCVSLPAVSPPSSSGCAL
jgi:hypothetical protein